MATAVDISGRRFGRLVAVRRIEGSPGRALWLCRCDCGSEHAATGLKLRAGSTSSCGCLRGERARGVRSAGGRLTPTYRSWMAMRRRIEAPTAAGFARYGGAGVTICERWRDFQAFLDDMGERPAGKTLDRVDNDRGYEPGNCRWATPKEQARNRATNRLITHDGETLPVASWAERAGLHRNLVLKRLNDGWPAAEALTVPPLSRRQAALSVWRTKNG